MEANSIYKDMIGEPYKIPVIYITQLLGLAFGIDPSLLGLMKNHDLKGVSPFISLEPFLKKVKEQLT
jgi:heterodisulfide reductase subunit B